MLKIIKDNTDYEFNFDGIKIFQNKNPSKLYKDVFKDASIYINGKNIKTDEVVYISELTTIDQFINLSKKSFLMSLILEEINENKIINTNAISKIVNEVNERIEYEIISQTEGDIIKIINNLFELTNIEYINKNNFKILLDFFFNDKKLIILDQCSWIELSNLIKYINKFNFVLLTNDFKELITESKQIELVVLESLVEIQDIDVLISYIEKEVNQNIDEEIIDKFIKKENTYLNYQINSILNKI